MGEEQSTVERVARAICIAAGHDPDALDSAGLVKVPRWKGLVKVARAAIKAMREPTDAMLKAAAGTPGMKAVDALAVNHFARTGQDTLSIVSADGSPLAQAWRAAIDATLAERPAT